MSEDNLNSTRLDIKKRILLLERFYENKIYSDKEKKLKLKKYLDIINNRDTARVQNKLFSMKEKTKYNTNSSESNPGIDININYFCLI